MIIQDKINNLKSQRTIAIFFAILFAIMFFYILYGYNISNQKIESALDIKRTYETKFYVCEEELSLLKPKTKCSTINDCIYNQSLKGCSKVECNSCCNNFCTLMAC